MTTLHLKRLTGFAWGHDNVAPEVFVNPLHVSRVEPRIVVRGRAETTEGTRVFFSSGESVLDVREDIGLVVHTLTSNGGTCRDCYQELPEPWMSVCAHCRELRHNGVDADYEAARADLVS